VFNSCFGANFELLEDKAHLGTESDDEGGKSSGKVDLP
jgi:hypothetical protein